MQIFNLPFYDERIEVPLPDRWEVNFIPINGAHPLSLEDMQRAFLNPIGSPRIRDLAKGKKTVAVAVEDVSRPTPTHLFLPLLVEELRSGGISEEDIRFVSGIGLHRPQMTPDFRRKLGDWITDNFTLVNPSLYEGQRYMGTTKRGTRVELYCEFADADLKIGVGGIIPHGNAGLGGGGKILVPGVASWQTIGHIHHEIKSGTYGIIEGNEFRENLDEVARVAGLDAIVNGVICRDRNQLAGLFVGDAVEAHRAGAKLALRLFTVDAPREVDIVITDGYPMDIDLGQSGRALVPARATVKEGGAVLLISAMPDGRGYHASMYWRHSHPEPPRPSPGRSREFMPKDIQWLLYSPTYRPKKGERYQGFSSLEDAIAHLESLYLGKAKVNVFPQGALSLVK